jgi:hypothetical protein
VRTDFYIITDTILAEPMMGSIYAQWQEEKKKKDSDAQEEEAVAQGPPQEKEALGVISA